MKELASKTLNTILSLQDNASKKLVGVSKNFKTLSKEAQKATLSAQKSLNNLGSNIEKTVTKIGKIGLTTAATLGGIALGTGLSEAMDLEGYRIQLETATKDTTKAGEIMKYAMNLANKTPFEAAPLVEGASKLEMMGLSAMKYLPLVGDMAAATNKPVDQAVEAMIDAQTGELERLKEFGITKAKIVEKGNELYRDAEIVNNKGQIVDQKKFNEALEAVMTERYSGGMEKLSNSTKGMWSTVTGTTKTALSQIVGMTLDGTIKQGSLLDKLKGKVKTLADKFEEWQNNGTIDKIAQKFSECFTKVYDVISKVIKFVVENKEMIITIASMAVTFTLVSKAIRTLSVVVGAFKVVWAILNGTLLLSPVGWIIIGITALVGAFVLAYQKSETFRNIISSLWQKIKELGAQLLDWVNSTIVPIIQQIAQSIGELWNSVIYPFLNWLVGVLQPIFAGVWEAIVEFVSKAFISIGKVIENGLKIINGIIEFITGVFTLNWEKAWNGISEVFSGIIDGIKAIWEGLISFLSAPVNAVVNIAKHVFGGDEDATEVDSTDNNAVGTNYFRGGTTWVGEHGPELMTLPRGTQIKTNSQSNKIANGNSNIPPIQIIIQGNVIGNEEFVNYAGSVITDKIILALGNM